MGTPQLLAKTDLPDIRALQPGDSITRIAGQPVNSNGASAIAQLYAAMETSGGKAVPLTVKSAEGQIRTTTVTPHLSDPFSGSDLSFLGMVPRASIAGLLDNSPAIDKLKPGDVILSVDAGTDHLQNPTCKQIHDTLLAAGDKELKVSLKVSVRAKMRPGPWMTSRRTIFPKAADISVWEFRSERTNNTWWSPRLCPTLRRPRQKFRLGRRLPPSTANPSPIGLKCAAPSPMPLPDISWRSRTFLRTPTASHPSP